MLSVAYQGEPGAFSEQAVRRFFGRKAKLVPMEHFDDVFRFTAGGGSKRGLVPIENSVFGSVHQNYDLLLDHKLSIVGEVTLRIHHHLMALPGVRLNHVKFVFSHPQALGQCEDFLRTLRGTRQIPHNDTAGAAKMIREDGRTNAAAVASVQAARTYRLNILRRNVENNHHNYTRFLVLARSGKPPARKAKTSLVFATKNVPGALFQSLAVFALREVNLLKIESRPFVGKPWQYLFYLDVLGSPRDERVRTALKHLEEVSTFVRILGAYPVGRTFQE
ncbi:MAG: prephenate dehydratase [Bacteroidota bacterium]